MKIVHWVDAPALRWRNGGGVTRELLAWPSPDDWRLRLSVADVASNGPFSCFPGVTRLFAVLEGAGVRLDWPDRHIELRVPDEPILFDGAAAPVASLLDGPVRDFNLMFSHGRAGLLPASHPWQPGRGSHAGLFACVAGQWSDGDQTCRMPAFTLLWSDVASGNEWRFQPDTPTRQPGWWIFHEDGYA